MIIPGTTTGGQKCENNINNDEVLYNILDKAPGTELSILFFSFSIKGSFSLTFLLGIDHVENLADCVFYRQAVDVEIQEPLQDFFVEIDQLKQGEDTISIQIHASEPILNAVRETEAKLK